MDHLFILNFLFRWRYNALVSDDIANFGVYSHTHFSLLGPDYSALPNQLKVFEIQTLMKAFLSKQSVEDLAVFVLASQRPCVVVFHKASF